jgi:hypothetical protein
MSDKITQDFKFLQQMFSGLTSEQVGGMHITVVGNVTNEARKFDFFEFLQSLPEPRMESLKDAAIKTAVEHLGSKIAAGRFLKLAQRTVRMRTNEKSINEIEVKKLPMLESKETSEDD